MNPSGNVVVFADEPLNSKQNPDDLIVKTQISMNHLTDKTIARLNILQGQPRKCKLSSHLDGPIFQYAHPDSEGTVVVSVRSAATKLKRGT